MRAVLPLPYLIRLYLSRAYSKLNTSHSKTYSEDNIPIPVWSSYLNFTLIFIDFPGTYNPEPISHIKIAYNYNTSTSAYHFKDIFFPTITCCALWLGYFKFIFLFICNPSISNPGPDSPYKHKLSSTLSVFYQNIQGLIPFGNLAENHPVLDNNKFLELHSYICNHSPNIIILNETWLKPSILDSEIFPSNKYKIFRLDRSEKTHPIGPLNTKKYRHSGVGVLIAINASLQIDSKVNHTNCSAELVAIELILPNITKIIVTTCYRVGTLGMSNCSEILNTLGKLSRKKMLRKLIIVGDFNLIKNQDIEKIAQLQI